MAAPLWISHRGYCRSATENTSAAFHAAIDLGFTHLETDLRSTADGHLVLAHDDDLERISGVSIKVTESSRSELESISLSGGEPLLFFDRWLEEFGHRHWILDIKPEQGKRTVELLLEQWKDPAVADLLNQRTRFLFWKPRQQALVLEEQPQAVCMATIAECRRAGGACLLGLPALGGIEANKTYALPPVWGPLRLLTKPMVERYHRQGARVLGYLPETDQSLQWALEAGVDEVLTNYRIV